MNGGYEAEDAFGVEPVEETEAEYAREPVDQGDEVDKVDKVAQLLERLDFASPQEGEADTETLLDDKDYFRVVRLLEKGNLSSGESNNLGCAYAWLAHTESNLSYWERSLDRLENSARSAKGAGERKRAKANIDLVGEASEL